MTHVVCSLKVSWRVCCIRVFEVAVALGSQRSRDEGLFTLTQCLDNEREHDEPEKEHIELLKAREDPAKALQASEQALDFVASFVELPVVRPGGESVLAGRHHGREPEGHREVAGRLALVGAGAACALPARRGPGQGKGRTLGPSAHSRQPDAAWWSSRRETCRWLGGRFF